jgi:hypothetical protein
MIVEQIQPHQMVEHVHDCHHYEHSLPLVRLLFMVFFYEWLRALLSFSTQLVQLHFDVVH